MAVYRRGYNRYQGPITGRLARLLVLPKYSWRRVLQQRWVVILLVMAMFYPLGCIGFVYLSNHVELLSDFGSEIKDFLQIDGNFFLIFMRVQLVFTMILTIVSGRNLIAPDLSNGALQLYFSRPLSRTEYVLARLLVLLGLLSLITWIPGLLIFSLQSGMAGWSWFAQNWNLGLGVLIGSLLWILFISLIALTCWAYIRRKIMAELAILWTFFVLNAVSEIVNNLLDVTWASFFNPRKVIDQIWNGLLGITPESGPTVLGCWLAVLVMTALLLMVLTRKLRPVEVVS
jgi:ABC-2 type transport system permease protein